MRWSQLPLALHILLLLCLFHPLNGNYYPDNPGRDIYYNDDEDFNEQLYNEQLGEIVRELAESPSFRENNRYQQFDYVGKNSKEIADDAELLRDPENYFNKDSENINGAAAVEVLKKGNEKLKNKNVDDGKNGKTSSLPVAKQKAALPQKKGQNEFVGFVEPKPEKQLKHVEQLEKRVESSSSRVYTSQIGTSGNLLASVATVCLIAAVLGIVGGAYYFHKIRSQRVEDAFSNFSHYAPTGPGKEKKKKDGDEGLAYRAQLHHYQQTKQKIISGSEQDIGIPEPDDASEASDYDENNFSVYECPGLAPTGDIEVQNPNFTRP